MKNSHQTFCVLLFLWCLLQTQDCRGQALIGSSRPIVARVGDDVILPCFFQTPRDAAALTLEWTRPDLDPRFVFVWRSFEELMVLKHTQFVDRAFLFQDALKQGNISLKLTNVKPEDSGVYRCFIPAQRKETSVRLIIGSCSSVSVSVAAVDPWRAGVVLQCVSRGWFPEPELSWLDSEGRAPSVKHALSESDGLYDVSSRVTVEQSGTFSCVVTQRSSNLTEQSSVQVSDELVGVRICPLIIGLTVVGLVVLAGLVLSILFWIIKRKHSQTYGLDQKKTCADEESTPQGQVTCQTCGEASSAAVRLKSTSAEEENESLKRLVQEVKCQRTISESKSPVIIDHVDQYGRNLRLRKTCSEVMALSVTVNPNIKDWSIRIEVDNDPALNYKIESSFTLRADKDLTIWAKGWYPPNVDFHCNKEWENQAQWNTGKIAFVSLFNDINELMDRTCERMYRNQ